VSNPTLRSTRIAHLNGCWTHFYGSFSVFFLLDHKPLWTVFGYCVQCFCFTNHLQSFLAQKKYSCSLGFIFYSLTDRHIQIHSCMPLLESITSINKLSKPFRLHYYRWRRKEKMVDKRRTPTYVLLTRSHETQHILIFLLSFFIPIF